jgi:hypothetical protein
VTLAGIVVTLLAWPLLRRFDGRGIGLRIGASLVIMLPAALALAVINQQAFASIEQRIMERKLNEEAAKEPARARHGANRCGQPVTAPGQTTAAAPSGGIRMRHDLSGNVLVDLPDPVAPKASSPPPPPPEPPAAQVPPPATGARFPADRAPQRGWQLRDDRAGRRNRAP